MRIAGRTFCRVGKFVPGRDHICRVLRGGPVVAHIESEAPDSKGITAHRDPATCKRQIADEIDKFRWKIYINNLEVLLKITKSYTVMYCRYYNNIHGYVKKYTRVFHVGVLLLWSGEKCST